MNQEDLQMAINEHRLLVLIENEEGKFQQVTLNAEQFKKVSDAVIAGKHPEEEMRPGMEAVHLHLKEDWELEADLFLGLSSIDKEQEGCEFC